MALELVRGLWKRYPEEEAGPGRVGVITPYKQQLHLLKARFAQGLGSERSARIEMNTVDGFQGREVDVLIFSTVRATGGGIGFVADVRRMNVALTRAKLSLWIVGNRQTLGGGQRRMGGTHKGCGGQGVRDRSAPTLWCRPRQGPPPHAPCLVPTGREGSGPGRAGWGGWGPAS